LPALKARVLLAAIFREAPVWGLRPVRALRSRRLKVPNPKMETFAPAWTVLPMRSKMPLAAS
jgi:hypothetical protein